MVFTASATFFSSPGGRWVIGWTTAMRKVIVFAPLALIAALILARIQAVPPGQVKARHRFPRSVLSAQRWPDSRHSFAKRSGALASLACFPPPRGRYRGREVGGGRATRQPGQVRKEAALTSAVRVARQPPTLFFGDLSGMQTGCRFARPGAASYIRTMHPGILVPRRNDSAQS